MGNTICSKTMAITSAIIKIKNNIIKKNILDTNITGCFCKYNVFSYTR